MERYNQLADMYLKYQKKRTVLTILGVALASGILFAVLTLYFSNFISQRDRIRAEENYEMVFFPETEEQIAGIINEDFVKDVYAGSYYDAYNGTYIDGSLFVNVKNPYRINKCFETICQEYGVEGQIHDKLASYYLQGDIGEGTYIIFLMFLFLSVIFSIIGVGIIRNSIQLNTLEQVKDYGILRCVGATQGQLKSVIFRMGFLQEMTGIAAGMVLGFLAAVIIGAVSGIKAGIHIVPVLFVLVAFIGDLFFVMTENSKIVKRLSPLAAVRGNFSAKTQKLKRRGKGIFGRIFGVEGEYAYKSLMGNKSRFFKSVASFGLGIAAFIMISVGAASINNMIDRRTEAYGEYQYYICVPVGVMVEAVDINEAKSRMPSYEILEKLAQDDKVEDVKPMYIAWLAAADYEAVLGKYSQEYLDKTYMGDTVKRVIRGREESPKIHNAHIQLIGYDEEEMKAHEELLLEGTLDVSEHGIVIERQIREFPLSDDGSYESMFGKYYTQNDYKLGDTIDILDFERYNSLIAQARKEYEDSGETGKWAEAYCACWRKLREEGAYKTYTVEGIIRHNRDKVSTLNLAAIVPLDNYYAMTGLGEADSNGLKYKMSGFSRKAMNLLYGDEGESGYIESGYVESSYIYEASAVSNLKKSLRYVAMFVVFIVVMSSVNIINTSASNLYLRRGELAQLRAIGVSKRKLCYIVMLEGVITSITANVLGCALGFAGLIPLKQAIIFIFGIDMTYPVAAAVAGIIVSTFILCASIYFPIKRMSNSVLGDLNAGGD